MAVLLSHPLAGPAAPGGGGRARLVAHAVQGVEHGHVAVGEGDAGGQRIGKKTLGVAGQPCAQPARVKHGGVQGWTWNISSPWQAAAQLCLLSLRRAGGPAAAAARPACSRGQRLLSDHVAHQAHVVLIRHVLGALAKLVDLARGRGGCVVMDVGSGGGFIYAGCSSVAAFSSTGSPEPCASRKHDNCSIEAGGQGPTHSVQKVRGLGVGQEVLRLPALLHRLQDGQHLLPGCGEGQAGGMWHVSNHFSNRPPNSKNPGLRNQLDRRKSAAAASPQLPLILLPLQAAFPVF